MSNDVVSSALFISGKVGYKNWRTPPGMATAKSADCAEMYPSGKWQPVHCGRGRSFVCQKIEKATPSKMTTRFGGTGGCHKRYGCGGKTAGCSTLCQRIRALRERRKERSQRRQRVRRQARRRRAERHEWRERMRRVREYRNKRLRKALNNLRDKHDRASRTYAYIASLLHTKLKQMKYSGQLAPVGMDRIAYSLGAGKKSKSKTKTPRRLIAEEDPQRFITLDDEEEHEDQEMRVIDAVSRCKWISNSNGHPFEICVIFHVGSEYFSLELKTSDEVVNDNIPSNGLVYTEMMRNTEDYFMADDKLHKLGLDWTVNPIESNLGHAMTRLKTFYSKKSPSTSFVHYFDEFRFDYFGTTEDNDPEECSVILNGLPFKMCLSTLFGHGANDSDVVLYFTGAVESATDTATEEIQYSEYIKELIDYGFEHYRFHFNVESDWDEVERVDHHEGVQWTKKCNHRLLIATVCVERFDVNHHRASIKMREWTQKRIISSEDILDSSHQES